MKNNKKILITCLTIIAVACLATAGILIASGILEDGHAKEIFEELRESADESESIASEDSLLPNISPTEFPTSNETTDEVNNALQNKQDAVSTNSDTSEDQPYVSPYRDSFLANKDMAGWLQIPGTVIDYPIMWTPEDENYYLYRDFEGNENKNGCLILDTDSSVEPLTTNLIIHGHNMRSGAMFGNLTDYEDEDYCKNHKKITLYTEEGEHNYEVIAVFRSQVFKKSDTVFKYYKFFQADTQEEFDDFYQNIKALSQYDTGVTAQFGDHFITLSTCVYHVDKGRFVVVAKEVDNGEN